MAREFVSGIYKRELDAQHQPTGNFADTINEITNKAKAARAKKDRRKANYGSYSSPGAQGSPATRRLTNRITGEKDD
jgi:hypothetical protein